MSDLVPDQGPGLWHVGHSKWAHCHVTADGCIADDASGSSAVVYGNNEACSFTFTGTANIVSAGGQHGAHMSTESGNDMITVDGVSHSGSGLNWEVAVAGSKAFTWRSDGSVQGGGFKLCPR